MAAKSKSRKRIYGKKESERKAEKGFTKRCGKKKGEYVYGAPAGKLKLVESKKKQEAGIVK